MSLLRVGTAVLNQTPLDWSGNQRRVLDVLREARAAGVGVLCMPELCLTGYGCEDAFLSPAVAAEAERLLGELLPETKGLVVALGLPLWHRGGIYDAAALAADGKLLGLALKRHLAGDGIHYEPRWFKPWPEGVVAHQEVLGRRTPVGDLLFDVGGVRIGFEICEDAWVAERPGIALARAGVDVILNPSASHFAFGKRDVRHNLVVEGSRAFFATYLYANLLGNEAGRAIYDGGALIASDGRLVAAGRRFSFAERELLTAVVDLEANRARRASSASFRPHPCPPGDRLVEVEHHWPPAGAAPPAGPLAEGWESGPQVQAEELFRAQALALFDYLRKSRAAGFVINLSGGCDSAAVSALAALSLRLARRALGAPALAARLPHLPAAAVAGEDELVRSLVTTVYQATAQSSQTTRTAARELAAALACRHLEIDVEPLVQGYLATLGEALRRPLGWEQDDLALQNLQARVRGPGAWLIANVEGKLLLVTSNRSEAAVGYSTMDGDTCGGLAPIAAIDKAHLREWLAWLGATGPAEVGPIPALQGVLAQPSTPELRPAVRGQTSENDLMPFPVLEAVQRLAIAGKLAPRQVLERMRGERPELDPGLLAGWIERFFVLFARNQWKRERYAPSFHLDDDSLDPRTRYRFPILSGGFERELRALRAAVSS